MASATMSVARSEDAFCVRLGGRCTLEQSPVFHEFAERTLRDSSSPVYVDAGDCEYLDSTFLGSLLDLHRKFGRGDGGRFFLVAPDDARERLFAAMRLTNVFAFAPDTPAPLGNWVEICSGASPSNAEMAKHIMECHRRLAETDCPGKKAFAMIADNLEKELAAAPPPKSK